MRYSDCSACKSHNSGPEFTIRVFFVWLSYFRCTPCCLYLEYDEENGT